MNAVGWEIGETGFNYWGSMKLDKSENGIVLRGADSPIVVRGNHRHALAALCLHQQPFGFNPVDDVADLNPPAGSIVEALRDVADAIDRACGAKMIGVVHIEGPAGRGMIAAHYAEQFRACAAVIAALLPPENP